MRHHPALHAPRSRRATRSLLAALRLLEAGGGPPPPASFDRALAAEASPTWRALALLGRGLCEELQRRAGGGSADRRGRPGGVEGGRSRRLRGGPGRSGPRSLDRVRTATSAPPSSARLGGSRERSPPEVLGAVLLELGSAAAESGEAQTAAARWQEALERGDPATRAAAAANLGRLAAARGRRPRRGVDVRARHDGGRRAPRPGGRRRAWSPWPRRRPPRGAGTRWTPASAGRCRSAARTPTRRGVAEVLHDLGIAYWRRDQLQRATRSLEECRARAEEVGDDALRGAALRALAAVALQDGRLVVALAYAQEATLAASTPEDRRAVAAVLRQVGDEARRQGSDFAER